jgi:hypothetical protein
MSHRRIVSPSFDRSAFAGYRFPPEVILLAVRWYLRYGLSYRDVEELLAERGIEVDHVTIYRWVQRFTPLLIDAARPCRHSVGDRWFVDETLWGPNIRPSGLTSANATDEIICVSHHLPTHRCARPSRLSLRPLQRPRDHRPPPSTRRPASPNRPTQDHRPRPHPARRHRSRTPPASSNRLARHPRHPAAMASPASRSPATCSSAMPTGSPGQEHWFAIAVASSSTRSTRSSKPKASRSSRHPSGPRWPTRSLNAGSDRSGASSLTAPSSGTDTSSND